MPSTQTQHGALKMPKIKSKKKTVPYHHGNLRPALLKEAAKLIKTSGLEDLSLRKLAEKCGVSSMALYRHFPNKSALILAVLTQGYEILQQNMAEISKIHSSDDIIDLLKAIGYGYFDFAIKNKNFFYLMYGENIFPQRYKKQLDEKANILFEFLKSVIKQGMERSKIIQADPNSIAFALWAYLHGITFLFLQGKVSNITTEVAIKKFLDQLMDYIYKGLSLH